MLLQATRSIVITINNFAGEGLGPLTCAHLRLTDVTAADASQHQSMGWFRFVSPAGAQKDRPTVVMAKLYKAMPSCSFCPHLPVLLYPIKTVYQILSIDTAFCHSNQALKTAFLDMA